MSANSAAAKVIARVLGLLVAMLFFRGASAQAVPAVESLFTPEWQSHFDAVQKTSIHANWIPGRDQALLYFLTGANYTNLLAISGDPKRAEALGAAIAAAAPGGALAHSVTVYSSEDGRAVVQVQDSEGRFPEESAHRVLHLRAYFDKVKAAGFTPQIIVRVPKYGTLNESGPVETDTAAWRYLFAGAPEQASDVQFAATAPRAAIPVTVVVLLLPFLSVLAGMLVSAAIAKDTTIELKERRRRYSSVLNRFAYGGILIHAPIFLIVVSTRAYLPYADVWFGTASLTYFIPVFLIAPLAMIVWSPFAAKRGRSLFGAAQEAPPEQAYPRPFPASPVQRQFAQVSALASLTLFVVGIIAVFALPPGIRFLPLLLYICSGPIIARWAPAVLPNELQMDFLDAQCEAQDLGAALSVRVNGVQLEKGNWGRYTPAASAKIGGQIRISQRLLQVYSPAERRFMIAVCVAQLKMKTPQKTVTATWTLPLIALLSMICAGFGSFSTPMSEVLVFGPLFLMLPGAYFVLRPLARRMLTAADRSALKITGDLHSARSAATKVYAAGPFPGTAEVGDGARPALDERIRNLDQTAREFGLLDSASSV